MTADFVPEKIQHLKRQVQLGNPLTPADATELREFLNLELAGSRSFDLDEISSGIHGGRLQEQGIRATQRHYASQGWQGRNRGGRKG